MRTWDDSLKYGFNVPFLKVGTSDGHNFVLLEAFTYITKNGEIIEASVNMGSDGASTPQIMWNILPPFGEYWMAVVLHDIMYRYLQLPKDRCDEICKEAMTLLGAAEHDIFTIYQGVQCFGWNSFNEDRIEQMKKVKL